MSQACTLRSTLLLALLGLSGPLGATVIPFPVKAKAPSCEDNAALPPPTQLVQKDATVFQGHSTRLRTADHARLVRINFEIPEGFTLERMSADGRFYVLANHDFSATKLRSVDAGLTLAERVGDSTDVTFSPDSKFAALRTNDVVEILDLEASGKVLAKYDLGSVDERVHWTDGTTTGLNARGEFHYLPKTNEIAAFFDSYPPLLLKLGKSSTFKVIDLAKGVVPLTSHRMYRGVGYVSPSGTTLIARVMEPLRRETTLEFYDLHDHAYLRSITVPSFLVGEVALSQSDRLFAVSVPLKNVIQVFDFHHSETVPRWEIEVPEGVVHLQQLKFLGEDQLLVTRDDDKTVLQYSLK